MSPQDALVWLTFAGSAFFGLIFGAIVGLHLQDYALKRFSDSLWRHTIAKRLQTEAVLADAEAQLKRQREGGWDVGSRPH